MRIIRQNRGGLVFDARRPALVGLDATERRFFFDRVPSPLSGVENRGSMRFAERFVEFGREPDLRAM
jgi:hypothetical protein